MIGRRSLGPVAVALAAAALAACNAPPDRAPTGTPRTGSGSGSGTGSAEAEAPVSPARRYFGDAVLVDQRGERHRFYSDLVHDRIVVIAAFFTRCTSSCPVLAGTFVQLQAHLGERLGRDVYLLSISVDPQNDTPDKLAEYAQRFQARPGWYFLTGDRAEVEPTLARLGQWVDDPSGHKSLVLAGNDRTGLWKKAFGLARPEAVIAVVDSVVDDPGEAAAAALPPTAVR